jgi:predicted nucleic-acid-binding protein
MAALDTNVLVRFIVADDALQAKSAARLIDRSIDQGVPLFVPITVSLELVWVLRSAYALDKAAVLKTLYGLLGTFELRFESERALEIALKRYEHSRADFADCLHSALAAQAGEEPLWTFDKTAAKVDGARLLT